MHSECPTQSAVDCVANADTTVFVYTLWALPMYKTSAFSSKTFPGAGPAAAEEPRTTHGAGDQGSSFQLDQVGMKTDQT